MSVIVDEVKRSRKRSRISREMKILTTFPQVVNRHWMYAFRGLIKEVGKVSSSGMEACAFLGARARVTISSRRRPVRKLWMERLPCGSSSSMEVGSELWYDDRDDEVRREDGDEPPVGEWPSAPSED